MSDDGKRNKNSIVVERSHQLAALFSSGEWEALGVSRLRAVSSSTSWQLVVAWGGRGGGSMGRKGLEKKRLLQIGLGDYTGRHLFRGGHRASYSSLGIVRNREGAGGGGGGGGTPPTGGGGGGGGLFAPTFSPGVILSTRYQIALPLGI